MDTKRLAFVGCLTVLLCMALNAPCLAISDEPSFNKKSNKGGDVSISSEPSYMPKKPDLAAGGHEADPRGITSEPEYRKGGDAFPGGEWEPKNEADSRGITSEPEYAPKPELQTEGHEADPKSISSEPSYRKVKKVKK